MWVESEVGKWEISFPIRITLAANASQELYFWPGFEALLFIT